MTQKDKISGNALNESDTKGSKNGTDPARSVITDKIHALFKGQCQRILLVLPHQFITEMLNVKNAKNKRYYNYPPYGLGLLCSNLKKRGYEVSLLDLNSEVLAFIHREKDEESIKTGISPLWKEKNQRGLRQISTGYRGYYLYVYHVTPYNHANSGFHKTLQPEYADCCRRCPCNKRT